MNLPDLYLDVDGVMLANGVKDEPNVWLLKAVFENRHRFNRIFWLSCWTLNGDATELYAKHPAFACLEATPLKWNHDKTEAIDWSRPFVWIEDGILDSERAEFRIRAGKNQFVCELSTVLGGAPV